MDTLTYPHLPPRRARGELERAVRECCDRWIEDRLGGSLDSDVPLTAYRIACWIEQTDPTRRRPSTGAVTTILNLWEQDGAARTQTGPYAFVGWA